MSPAATPQRSVRRGVTIERALALLVVAGIVWVALFFSAHGYLPPPFFDDSNDTFMDWYNTAYWVYTPGAYQTWLSVYPPLSFVFLRFFTNPLCYGDGGPNARACDHLGVVALLAFTALNLALVYFTYRKDNPRTALPRAVAVGVGLPMLFALERGNLIIPCFTFFVLGHGRLLKSAWAKWLCVAVSINFKPYLIVAVLGGVLRRRWRWAEGCAVAIAGVYLISFAIFGQGSPMELIGDLFGFSSGTATVKLNSVAFSSSYNDLLRLIQSPYPIMRIVGSRLLERLDWLLPAVMRLGEAGVLAVFAGAVWRPTAVPAYRLAALAMSVLLSVSQPGGYAGVFLCFLVFLEPWRGMTLKVALVVCYLVCIPWDTQVILLAKQFKDSYLSGLRVDYDLGITAGAFARPAMYLMIQYALVAASLGDLVRGALSPTSFPAWLIPRAGGAPAAGFATEPPPA